MGYIIQFFRLIYFMFSYLARSCMHIIERAANRPIPTLAKDQEWSSRSYWLKVNAVQFALQTCVKFYCLCVVLQRRFIKFN